MEFLIWHYSQGIDFYLKRWFRALAAVSHFFSLGLLLPTLFSPWKRLVDSEEKPGFHPEEIFRQFTFNIVSRGMGAVVRLILFLFGLLSLIPILIVGLIGFIFWLIFPPIGGLYYIFHDPNQKRFLNRLVSRLPGSPVGPMVFSTKPGQFILSHTNLTLQNIVFHEHKTPPLDNFSPKSFQEVMEKLIVNDYIDRTSLHKKGVDYSDLVTASYWWDRKFSLATPKDDQFHFTRPGIGLDLLFGYTPQLDQYSSDLSLPQEFTHRLIGREQIVSRMDRILTSGNSILLIGQPGVGKKTVVLEFAKRAMSGELSQKMTYKRVLEFDYNFLLSESLDINKKKTRLSLLLSEAASAGNVILVIKDIHRLTHQDVEGVDFTDIFESFLEKRNLKIIAIASNPDYERFIASNSRLRKHLEPVEIIPPSKEDATKILIDACIEWESKKPVTILVQSLRATIDGSDKYITQAPFPEKALEILDHTITYIENQKRYILEPDDINTVIAEKTGISLARLTEKEKTLLGDLENVLHKQLVGQDPAVNLIAKSLRARSVGAKNENRPIGSFLFLGPTGVGKTETAKALAQIYYGSQEHVLRFDMAEFAGPEGLSRLIGSVNQNFPGILTTAIKNRPASLLLLDEIEKAPPHVYNLFLTLLDEGSITDAFGHQINGRHLFVVATSNAGASYIRELVSQGTSIDELQKLVLNYVQKNNIFTPEFLNRFDGVVVYHPLDKSHLEQIAQLMLNKLAKSFEEKNIKLSFDPKIFNKIAEEGFEPEFGARPMRRIVDLTIGDILGKAILTGEVNESDTIELIPLEGKDQYQVKKI